MLAVTMFSLKYEMYTIVNASSYLSLGFHATSLHLNSPKFPTLLQRTWEMGYFSHKHHLCWVNRIFICLCRSCQLGTKMPVFTAFYRSTKHITFSFHMWLSDPQLCQCENLATRLISPSTHDKQILQAASNKLSSVLLKFCQLMAFSKQTSDFVIKMRRKLIIFPIDSKIKLNVCSVITPFILETASNSQSFIARSISIYYFR